MIRSFHLRDTRLVARLQQIGSPLDIEEQLIHPRSPLRSVLINRIFSLRSGPSTFILDQKDENGRLLGMAQMRLRPGRLERDVVFMSPALGSEYGSHAIWQRLLTHLSVQAADQGYFRIYAGLPVDSEELQIFEHVGFRKYSQEDIYKLSAKAKRKSTQTPLQLRPQKPSDGWGLQKLYATVTPRTIQNTEGLAQGQWSLRGWRWGEQGRRLGYVWEENGELLGAIHLHAGKQGYWIRTLLHPDGLDQIENLGQAALNLTTKHRLPVYFAIRQYEVGWKTVLTKLKFQFLTSQIRAVKPMIVRVREKRSRLISPLPLEKGASERVVTPTISQSEIISPKKSSSQNGHAQRTGSNI